LTKRSLRRSSCISGAQLAEAEAAYLRVLQADGDNPNALHFLGIIRHHKVQSLRGIHLVRRALEISPTTRMRTAISARSSTSSATSRTRPRPTKARWALRPDHPKAGLGLAAVRDKLKTLEESAGALRRAIDKDRGTPRITTGSRTAAGKWAASARR
jgi:hypothetical protein